MCSLVSALKSVDITSKSIPVVACYLGFRPWQGNPTTSSFAVMARGAVPRQVRDKHGPDEFAEKVKCGLDDISPLV